MKLKLYFTLKYWVCWVLLAQLARLLFVLYNFDAIILLNVKTIATLFFIGLKMDVSLAAYLTAPVILLLFVATIWSNFSKISTIKWYSFTVVSIIITIVLADVFLFKAWGTRLDASVLKYLQSPTEMYASMANLPIFWIILGLFLIIYLTIKGLKTWLSNILSKIDFSQQKFLSALLYLFLLVLLIVPARGGLQQIPLNQSSVYFSTNNFANQAALNVGWNFLNSTLNNKINKNIFIVEDFKIATRINDSLMASTSQVNYVVKQSIKPNIIFIIWESFTEKATHLTIKNVEVTPNFNHLKNEGIYFSNIFATGDRTDKGIVAVLSGYPAQPITSIIKSPQKVNKLPTISNVLQNEGYGTGFYYGGELEFANMKSYILGAGFNNLISKNDFDKKDQNSKWGVHDGVVIQKLVNDLDNTKPPFFYTWLTLTSHEPFETPVPTAIAGNSDDIKFLNALHYTDDVLGKFIAQSKLKTWWDNTLIVIVADHGHRMPATGKKIDDFKIPLLFLGGAIKKQFVMPNVGSQIDIASTVLQQLKLSSKAFIWSKNLLDTSYKPWAYFAFNNGYGFVQPNNYFIYDNVGKIPIEQNGLIDTTEIKKGKVLQQLSFQDYLEK